MPKKAATAGPDDTTRAADPYERKEALAIREWKEEEPGVLDKAFGVALQPLAWLLRAVVPESAVRAVLDAVNALAERLTDTADIKRDGGVANIIELRSKDLELSDGMANEVHNWAILAGTSEGAGTGVFGILTAPIDIPAILTIAIRTIHKIGLCYGYECTSQEDKQFVLGILAASGANEVAEKVAALTVLRSIQIALTKQTWKLMAQKAAQTQFSKEAAIIAVRNLAKQLGINLTKRKALAAIPVIGAVVGGSVNGWYVKEVGWAARRIFQERWLVDNHTDVGLDLVGE